MQAVSGGTGSRDPGWAASAAQDSAESGLVPPTGSHSSVVVTETPLSKPVCATSTVSEVAAPLGAGVGHGARSGARLLRAAAAEAEEQRGEARRGGVHEPCSRAAATISSMSGTSPGA